MLTPAPVRSAAWSDAPHRQRHGPGVGSVSSTTASRRRRVYQATGVCPLRRAPNECGDFDDVHDVRRDKGVWVVPVLRTTRVSGVRYQHGRPSCGVGPRDFPTAVVANEPAFTGRLPRPTKNLCLDSDDRDHRWTIPRSPPCVALQLVYRAHETPRDCTRYRPWLPRLTTQCRPYQTSSRKGCVNLTVQSPRTGLYTGNVESLLELGKYQNALAKQATSRRLTRARRLNVRKAAEQVREEYGEARDDLLGKAAEREAARWRAQNNVAHKWLLPPEKILQLGLTPQERGFMWDTGFGPVLSTLIRRRRKSPRFFPADHVTRVRDDMLLQDLENDRLLRVWPALASVERQALGAYTTNHAPYSFRVWQPGTKCPLQYALDRSSLTDAVLTYRIQEVTPAEWLCYSLSQVGSILHWPQPVATRVDPEPLGSLGLGHVDLDEPRHANGNGSISVVKFEIRAHKGIYIGGASQVASKHEQELLLPPDTNFRVEGHVDALVEEGNGSSHRRHFVQLQQM